MLCNFRIKSKNSPVFYLDKCYIFLNIKNLKKVLLKIILNAIRAIARVWTDK